jgi:hypothetical protein
MRRVFSIAVLGCAIASSSLAGTALGSTNEYAPEQQARDFNGGAGGWTFSTEYGGLCVPAVTCYLVGGEHVPANGAEGASDGYLRTDLTTIADAVTETNAIFRSPSFTYQGAGGEEPKKLTFTLDRRTDLGAVLPVITDDATFEVKALQAGGPAVTLIDATSMAGAEDAWTSVPQAQLDTDDLKVGKTYQIEITSTFQAGVQVIGTGTIDYDNVVIRAVGGGGGGGGAGNAGPGGGLTTAIKNNIGSATHKGNRIRVPVGCPRFVAPKKCALRVAARLKRKGGNATSTAGLQVRAGKKRTAVLTVTKAYRDQIEGRKRIFVRVRAQAGGGKKRTVIKRVKLRHA